MIMNGYIIVDFLVCLGFQLFVKVTDYFLLSTAHVDLRSLLSQEANGLTRTKVIALHGNKGTRMMIRNKNGGFSVHRQALCLQHESVLLLFQLNAAVVIQDISGLDIECSSVNCGQRFEKNTVYSSWNRRHSWHKNVYIISPQQKARLHNTKWHFPPLMEVKKDNLLQSVTFMR